MRAEQGLSQVKGFFDYSGAEDAPPPLRMTQKKFRSHFSASNNCFEMTVRGISATTVGNAGMTIVLIYKRNLNS